MTMALTVMEKDGLTGMENGTHLQIQERQETSSPLFSWDYWLFVE